MARGQGAVLTSSCRSGPGEELRRLHRDDRTRSLRTLYVSGISRSRKGWRASSAGIRLVEALELTASSLRRTSGGHPKIAVRWLQCLPAGTRTQPRRRSAFRVCSVRAAHEPRTEAIRVTRACYQRRPPRERCAAARANVQ